MTKIKVITDSSIQITDEEIKKYDITVIPLSIDFNGKVYVDGEDLSRTEFVKKMDESAELPKTSQPPLGEFVKVYDSLKGNDVKILGIFMAHTLSGTVDSARQAAEMTDADVTVIDSEFTDRAMAFQVIEAAKMAQNDDNLEDILKEINKIKGNTHLQMGVTNLKNIVKGGRLGKVAGTISTFLKINIALQMKDSKLDVVKKGRGVKTLEKYFDNVIDQIVHTKNLAEVAISYVDDTKFPDWIEDKIHETLPDLKIMKRVTSPIISTHAGSGAFAILYYSN